MLIIKHPSLVLKKISIYARSFASCFVGLDKINFETIT